MDFAPTVPDSSARTKAIVSIYEWFARDCACLPFYNVNSDEFELIAQNAYSECIKNAEVYPPNVRAPYLIRIIGQSGSGKTTQLYEALRNTAGHGFVSVNVGCFAKFHPEYELIKSEFGIKSIREKTNGFALLLLFRVMELLIEHKHSILLDLTVLDQRFESYFGQLLHLDYCVIYNALAVPRTLSDKFIQKREQQEGRIVSKSSADYFFEKLIPSLQYLGSREEPKRRFVLWNAYSDKNIADMSFPNETFFIKMKAEQDKNMAEFQIRDPAALLESKKNFYQKLTYFDSSLRKEDFLAILVACWGESKFFPPKHGSFEHFVNSIKITPINTGWTNFVFDVELDGINYIARFPRGACFSRAMKVDVAASNFVKSSTGLKIADAKLYFSELRPFSIHPKIAGHVLSSTADFTSAQIDDWARQIAIFFAKIHELTPPCHLRRRLSVFLRDVMSEVPFYKCLSLINRLEQAENDADMVSVHGDLNIGNIIVDDELNIVGFLDFAFFGVSVPEADLARITCRISSDLFDSIMKHYEHISGRVLRRELLLEMTNMWAEIERNYIEYMAQTMPDIKL
jgi:aminoglycoside phosphotransferase (APT) family kinase protein